MRPYNRPELQPVEPDTGLNMPLKRPPIETLDKDKLDRTLQSASAALLELQHPDGYWWFTLEANETIGAGFIQLMHFLGEVDEEIQRGIVNRILQVQREDGTWGLYHSAPGDLSTTVECYFSLRLAGFSPNEPALKKAKDFILSQGGLTRIRIFSRIHLALFGLVSWNECPVMPPELILLPPWAPVNIYHFSSWARASIVPLLVILNKRPTVKTEITLDELYTEPAKYRKFKHSRQTNPISIERLFLLAEWGMKHMGKIPIKKPWRGFAFEKAIDWVWDHMQRTEDIYPALAFGAIAFKAHGLKNSSEKIQTALKALKSFQQKFVDEELPATPIRKSEFNGAPYSIHQQCCISPVWDTPWSLIALLEANLVEIDAPKMMKAARWLLSKEIRYTKGDWHINNPKGVPGGWSFEFKNESFPDVDDTIEVLHVLNQIALPNSEKESAIERGLAWTRSMQNDDGGWGAFDKNNDLDLVNKIPFSDHGACLDPSSPDITGRAVELFLKMGTPTKDRMIKKALSYLKKSQEKFGGWFGRWGVNYIYGTWGVLTGLECFGDKNPLSKQTTKACDWLESIQNEDGGFSESPESYSTKKFAPYPESVASQTAWAVMALIAGGRKNSIAVKNGVQYLLDNCKGGTWEEKYFTGTGFPGHFYIRYHGYRHYFPLLALARFNQANSVSS